MSPHNLSEPNGILRLVITRVWENPEFKPRDHYAGYGPNPVEPPYLDRDVLRVDVTVEEFDAIRRALLELMEVKRAPQPE